MSSQDRSRKTSTGPNARPRDETIAQTGAGIPDDTGADNPDLAQAESEAEDPGNRVFKSPGQKRKEDAPERLSDQEPVEGDREKIEHELQRQSDKQRKR